MTDFEWPDPVSSPAADVLRTSMVSPAVGEAFAWSPGREYAGTHTVDGFPIESCRSCMAPIVWAITAAGERMPVDGPLDAGGNVVLAVDAGGKVTATVLDQAGLFGDGPRHTSHFATCPDADAWRSKRVGQR